MVYTGPCIVGMCEVVGTDQQPETHGNASMMVVEGSVAASPVAHARIAGEANNGLSDRQNAFVDFYCAGIPAVIAGTPEDVPPGNGQLAALAAGYAEVSAGNMANRNLLNRKVQDEIERRVKMGRGTLLLAAVTRGVRLMEESDDDRSVATVLLGFMDRFGLAPSKGPLVAIQNNVVGGDAAAAILKEVAEARHERLAGSRSDG